MAGNGSALFCPPFPLRERRFLNAMPWVAPPARLCSLCNGKVYPVEELHVDTVLYHRNCFRCQTCNKARRGAGAAAACAE